MNSSTQDEFPKNAVSLMSQQLWCWGRDILRPEGNWLLEVGFVRQPAPDERDNCNSVYSLELPREGCVILRAFGVFFGMANLGGIFLPRYEFKPRYTTESKLSVPPWNSEDLPEMDLPTPSQRACYVSLTLELIDWIRAYELNVLKHLGIEYRRATLSGWDDGERIVTPAEDMARTWRWHGNVFAENAQVFLSDTTNQGTT